MDENFIADDVPAAPSMSDFYPESGQLNVSDVRTDADAVKEKSLADELSEQLTLANTKTDATADQNENVGLSESNFRSEIGLIPSADVVGCSTVQYPVLPNCDAGYLEGFEAGAPPASYNEEVCEAATAPPVVFYEASAPVFEDQLAAEAVAAEQLMQQVAEETYTAIQPYTESQVIG